MHDIFGEYTISDFEALFLAVEREKEPITPSEMDNIVGREVFNSAHKQGLLDVKDGKVYITDQGRAIYEQKGELVKRILNENPIIW